MRATILSHDLGSNAFGRAHVMAKLASNFAEVEIVGPSTTGRIWGPLEADRDIRTRTVVGRVPTAQDALATAPDILIAIKTRRASLGVALKAARRSTLPVIADIDDWELAFYRENPRWWLKQCVNVTDPDNFWATLWAERQVARASGVTVASTFLQQRFGGELVVHARDAATFDPEAVDRDRVRAELGVAGRKVVLFMGSPRPHKGLADVVDAIERIDNPEIAFVVIGAGADLPRKSWLTVLNNRPFNEIPRFLVAADLVVLAQRPGPIANAQLPAKVFDAMAMARPVITTDVADLRSIVGPAGVVVAPNDVAALSSAIKLVLESASYAHELGSQARTRFLDLYSTDRVSRRLEEIVNGLLLGSSKRRSS